MSCLSQWLQQWGCSQVHQGLGALHGGCLRQLSLQFLSLPLTQKQLPGGAADARTCQPLLQLGGTPSIRHTGSVQQWSCLCSPALCHEYHLRRAAQSMYAQLGQLPTCNDSHSLQLTFPTSVHLPGGIPDQNASPPCRHKPQFP